MRLDRNFVLRIVIIVIGLSALVLSACSVVAPPPATPTPTSTPTLTSSPIPTLTATAVPPTPIPTETPAPTLIPSATPTTAPTLPPTTAPQETVLFTNDNWEFLDLPGDMNARLNNPLIAFMNTNNRTVTGGTPQPGNDIETLYYVSPTNSAGRVAIKAFDSSTNNQIYIAPSGNAFAYMRLDAGTSANGLYIADFNVGVTVRVLPIASLTQRGIFNEPHWKRDGSALAIALATGYDLDIYTISREGAWASLINGGSYDFWARWSPDGNYLAFVSDRLTCPSWRPGEAATCDGTGAPPPSGGHVFVLETATGRISQISDAAVFEPPRWVTPRQIAYVIGDPLFGDPERALYIADIFSGEVRTVRLNTGDMPLKLAESWSPNGQQVIFQAASDTTAIVLAQSSGAEIARISDLTFSRYGMAAAWSPDGTRIAIGGVAGQCPYGVIVTDSALESIARGNPPPSMCEPTFSPDGRWLAFTGVIASRDGRVDIYAAGNNGFGAVNLTGSLLGNIDLIGWVGGTG
ncbi:MAG: hypothetical protein SGJ24_09320 [Chloroflexota bacterium]|nr:hypothetical protein [Chloroflexota bacterium]